MVHLTIPRWSAYVLVAAISAALAFSFGALYTASGTSHDVTYYACLKNGNLTDVGTAPPGTCPTGGAVISWNSVGPPGEPGPAGEPGQPGAPGEPGADGVSGYETVSSESFVPPHSTYPWFVICPAGKVVLGGGPIWESDDIIRFDDGSLTVVESYPFLEGHGWVASVRNDGDVTRDFYVRATCATMAVEAP